MSACVCIDELDLCPPHCFIRATREAPMDLDPLAPIDLDDDYEADNQNVALDLEDE